MNADGVVKEFTSKYCYRSSGTWQLFKRVPKDLTYHYDTFKISETHAGHRSSHFESMFFPSPCGMIVIQREYCFDFSVANALNFAGAIPEEMNQILIFEVEEKDFGSLARDLGRWRSADMPLLCVITDNELFNSCFPNTPIKASMDLERCTANLVKYLNIDDVPGISSTIMDLARCQIAWKTYKRITEDAFKHANMHCSAHPAEIMTVYEYLYGEEMPTQRTPQIRTWEIADIEAAEGKPIEDEDSAAALKLARYFNIAQPFVSPKIRTSYRDFRDFIEDEGAVAQTPLANVPEMREMWRAYRNGVPLDDIVA